MAIFLLRHGETESNARRIVQTPDIPLSARGVAQADRLARRLAGEGIAHILSSDLCRAAMTAERLQAATGASLELEPLLQERNYGAIRGTEYDALGVDIFAPGYAPPEGETWETFDARVTRAWDRIRRAAGAAAGHLAVVSHGLFCRSLAAHHLALPDGWVVPEVWGNASLTIIEGAAPWTVRLLNCTAHLEDDAGPAPVAWL